MSSEKAREWTDFLIDLHPLILTGVGLAGSWFFTTAGAIPASYMPISKHITSLFYATMAGTMVSSATIGMLQEALRRARQSSWSASMPWIPVVIGMVCGLVMLQSVTLLVAFIHERRKRKMVKLGEYVEVTTSNGHAAKFVLDEDEIEPESKSAAVEEIAKRARDAATQRLQPASAAAMETVMPRRDESKKVATMRRTIMMVSALVLQQLPEGLMLGISFANVASAPEDDKHRAMRVALSGCISVWLGSLPEGVGMMLPLRKAHVHPLRGLLFVQAMMIMQIIAGTLGCLLVSFVTSVLPFALGAVACAMIFTALTEIVPAAYNGGSRMLSNVIIMGGFMLMLTLINLFG